MKPPDIQARTVLPKKLHSRLAALPLKRGSRSSPRPHPLFLCSSLPAQPLITSCVPLSSPTRHRRTGIRKKTTAISPIRMRAFMKCVSDLNRSPNSQAAYDGSGDFGEPFVTQDEDMSLPEQIEEIERRQLLTVPEYWELLQSSISHYARISSRSFVMQDWNERSGQLRVSLLRTWLMSDWTILSCCTRNGRDWRHENNV